MAKGNGLIPGKRYFWVSVWSTTLQERIVSLSSVMETAESHSPASSNQAEDIMDANENRGK
jgi:hypothetical protein